MTTIPTDKLSASGYPHSTDALHGFDRFVVHAGNTISAWGRRHHERRKLRVANEVDRRRLLQTRDDYRSTLAARAHSQLFP